MFIVWLSSKLNETLYTPSTLTCMWRFASRSNRKKVKVTYWTYVKIWLSWMLINRFSSNLLGRYAITRSRDSISIMSPGQRSKSLEVKMLKSFYSYISSVHCPIIIKIEWDTVYPKYFVFLCDDLRQGKPKEGQGHTLNEYKNLNILDVHWPTFLKFAR